MPYHVIVNQTENGQTILLENEGVAFAEIFSFGALLNQFGVYKNEEKLNVIDGFSSPVDAKNSLIPAFQSAKLSPFVCRLANASFEFENQNFKIEKHNDGNSAIHGLVFDQIFEVAEQSTDNKAEVTLSLTTDFEANGFPFPYKISVTYTLIDSKITVATTIENIGTSTMPINDGWHPYFKLGEEINSLEIQFRSDAQFVFSADLLPTGEKTAYTTFNEMQPLGETFFDNSFSLNDNDAAPALILQSKEIGLAIDVIPAKSYPILQIYTPPHRKSIAVENLTSVPDSFNNHIGLITLSADQSQTFTTSYQIRHI